MKHLLAILAVIGFSLAACQPEDLVDTSMNDIEDINSLADFQSAVSTGVSFVFFHASWCSNCEEQRPAVEASSTNPDLSFVKFIEIEYEDNKEITDNYSVPGFPTMIIFKDGEEKERLVGKGHSEQQIIDALNKYK